MRVEVHREALMYVCPRLYLWSRTKGHRPLSPGSRRRGSPRKLRVVERIQSRENQKCNARSAVGRRSLSALTPPQDSCD